MPDMSGKQLIALRKRLGKTQAEFAALLGVDRITIWRWETGRQTIDKFKAGAIKALVELAS